MLDQRLQILLDRGRMQRLRTESERRGTPVGELVRRAIDRQYPPRSLEMSPSEAAELILGSDPGAGSEPDWEQQKAEMLDEPFESDA